VPWDDLGVDIVLECSGKFKTAKALAPYFERGDSPSVTLTRR
jgi:glyceraldehyde 3-phosphate dehydrogenase